MKVWLTDTKEKSPIPYTPKKKIGSHQDYGYFDVKRHPELLHRIPELRTSRELLDFVRMLNGPETVFRTIGCDYGDRVSDNPHYQFMYLSFVTIVYDILEWNLDKSNFVGLYNRFEEFAGRKGDLPFPFGSEFSIGPTPFTEHHVTGFHFHIVTSAYGNTRSEAKTLWRDAFQMLYEFFVQENRMFPKSRYAHLRTVS